LRRPFSRSVRIDILRGDLDDAALWSLDFG
jgi:hypothetical protein